MIDESKLLTVNLQLFAEGEDDIDDINEDALDPDEVIEDEEIETDDLENEESNDEEIEQPTQPKDKVTHALIKQKQANKELKQRLEAFEQKEREKEQADRRRQIAEKLVEKGYDEDYAFGEADKHLEAESIKETVKKLEFMTENADIIAKYPEAKRNISKLLKLQKDTGWDIEKICRIEFEDADSSYDSKIKSEQEAQLKKKKRTVTPVGGQTPIQSVKLDPVDEKAYQFYAKRNPGVSRKQYNERLNNSNQNIPHDKWD